MSDVAALAGDANAIRDAAVVASVAIATVVARVFFTGISPQ